MANAVGESDFDGLIKRANENGQKALESLLLVLKAELCLKEQNQLEEILRELEPWCLGRLMQLKSER